MTHRPLTVLGIESSCDETAAAVVRLSVADGVAEGPGTILSNVVWGQEGLHERFGGVVPEIAARAHAERLEPCVTAALVEAGLGFADLDGIAVTAGPGLIGGVLAGAMLAKGLAFATGLPLVAVNHLEGHALTPRLTDGVAFPYLLLLVSGGHCQLIAVEGLGRYRRLGGTIDDAPGEAFDKVAKHMGLGFPGGPAVERTAAGGNARRFALPRPLTDRPGCDMSFSGLKTALRRAVDKLSAAQGGLHAQDRADLCAAFQAAVAESLAARTARALALFPAPVLAVAGGVAANATIRAALERVAAAADARFLAPPLRLCTDNAAMIAWAGGERLARGERSPLDFAARPRWPLDETAAPLLGAGQKGPKA
jgi:N6-L-threonylcarbamoyladenine synthase